MLEKPTLALTLKPMLVLVSPAPTSSPHVRISDTALTILVHMDIYIGSVYTFNNYFCICSVENYIDKE